LSACRSRRRRTPKCSESSSPIIHRHRAGLHRSQIGQDLLVLPGYPPSAPHWLPARAARQHSDPRHQATGEIGRRRGTRAGSGRFLRAIHGWRRRYHHFRLIRQTGKVSALLGMPRVLLHKALEQLCLGRVRGCADTQRVRNERQARTLLLIFGDQAKQNTLFKRAAKIQVADVGLQVSQNRWLSSYAHPHQFTRQSDGQVLWHTERIKTAVLRRELVDSWRDQNRKDRVPNGLSLCKLHHAAFDRHFLGLRPDYVIEVRRDILKEHDGITAGGLLGSLITATVGAVVLLALLRLIKRGAA
jgi:Transglycosylase associated protein/HNH endonuclease